MLWRTRATVLGFALLWMTHATLIVRFRVQAQSKIAETVAVHGQRLDDAFRRIDVSERIIADLIPRQVRIETALSIIEKLIYGIMVPLALLVIDRILQLVQWRRQAPLISSK